MGRRGVAGSHAGRKGCRLFPAQSVRVGWELKAVGCAAYGASVSARLPSPPPPAVTATHSTSSTKHDEARTAAQASPAESAEEEQALGDVASARPLGSDHEE